MSISLMMIYLVKRVNICLHNKENFNISFCKNQRYKFWNSMFTEFLFLLISFRSWNGFIFVFSLMSHFLTLDDILCFFCFCFSDPPSFVSDKSAKASTTFPRKKLLRLSSAFVQWPFSVDYTGSCRPYNSFYEHQE